MKEINIKKYLFENYNDDIDINTEFLELNMKNDKTFYKFIKICMKYKIYLFQRVNNEYFLRNTKSLIRLITLKKSELTHDLGTMILKLHNFDKYLETSTTDNFSDIYDTKQKIDQLYTEFNKNHVHLDQLIKMLNDTFIDDALEKYVKEEYQLPNKNNIIEEYHN
jgi:hypothetical protein